MSCRHTLQGPVIGHQDDGAGGLLELRNCVACGSTVSAEVTLGDVIEHCDCATCMRIMHGEHLSGCDCVGCEFRQTRADHRSRTSLMRASEEAARRHRARRAA